ncbi:MAG: peptidoglycan DD-metalloendopeptidase family protein [Gammaproteobacteria bacterium]|nr:peptidoglycan DD-metalloendopeptidase family protein [Gammaproteobacteria bacterium]MDH3369944.1 peptidoglycan DD-metalloendopeptidase family protein [Gammaproteobacteria bacterium]MDH3407227.1 peptidoglycan DD-metalloendopeptidase family protein [Gammaproteobacteria bacterium]MDH3562247.1 peptidoglycan DD-metalloendopeptidase family protein [Gammaproteobacteria bacterium]MDH5487643.1 peptidoglycan DD-metalloendopeptidase family protein [Gammaproteobacteria bacterium]
MNIILVPNSRHGKGRNTTLSHRHLILISLVVLVALPALLGIVAYHAQDMLSVYNADSMMAAQRRELAAQRTAVLETRRKTEAHLNALAQRMGQMQAQLMRLNALGSRLTRMAGLDAREFNFSVEAAMGGPEKSASSANPPELMDSLDRLTREIERQQERLSALENLLLDRKLNAAVTPSGWPVEGGWISSGFGMRADPFNGHQSQHDGVDIASNMGSLILAVGDGVVSHSGEKAGYGLLVEITHESGLTTRYAHTHTVLVRVGDRVQKGQAIAQIGTSGRSTGPHLHFEVVRNGTSVNPMRYLQQASK